jgi:hypothetical protein
MRKKMIVDADGFRSWSGRLHARPKIAPGYHASKDSRLDYSEYRRVQIVELTEITLFDLSSIARAD